MSDRAELVADRIRERMYEILGRVAPIQPGPAYWLDSDCCYSYCWKCAMIARGNEFELGVPLKDVPSYRRDEWQDAFYEGIDGGFDTENDCTQACEICGETLSYILTDYGVEQEVEYYREAPLIAVRDEDSYALDRLTLNIYDGSPRRLILGVAIAVNQAWRIVRKDPTHATR